MLKNFIFIAFGGAIGSILRYGVSLLLRFKNFPYQTFMVNVLGCFAIGLIMAYSLKSSNQSSNYKLFLTTGFCGGFTTFSTFSFEVIEMIQTGKTFNALLYITLSIVVGILATYFGYKLIL